MEKEKAALVQALKNAIAKTPKEDGVHDVGVLLDYAFELAGYSFELHQQGIQGTRVLAVEHVKGALA